MGLIREKRVVHGLGHDKSIRAGFPHGSDFLLGLRLLKRGVGELDEGGQEVAEVLGQDDLAQRLARLGQRQESVRDVNEAVVFLEDEERVTFV